MVGPAAVQVGAGLPAVGDGVAQHGHGTGSRVGAYRDGVEVEPGADGVRPVRGVLPRRVVAPGRVRGLHGHSVTGRRSGGVRAVDADDQLCPGGQAAGQRVAEHGLPGGNGDGAGAGEGQPPVAAGAQCGPAALDAGVDAVEGQRPVAEDVGEPDPRLTPADAGVHDHPVAAVGRSVPDAVGARRPGDHVVPGAGGRGGGGVREGDPGGRWPDESGSGGRRPGGGRGEQRGREQQGGRAGRERQAGPHRPNPLRVTDSPGSRRTVRESSPKATVVVRPAVLRIRAEAGVPSFQRRSTTNPRARPGP